MWCQSRGAEIKLPPGVEAEIKLPPGVEAEIKLPPGSGAEIKLPPGDGAEITKCGSSSGSFLFTTDLKKFYRQKNMIVAQEVFVNGYKFDPVTKGNFQGIVATRITLPNQSSTIY